VWDIPLLAGRGSAASRPISCEKARREMAVRRPSNGYACFMIAAVIRVKNSAGDESQRDALCLE